MAALSAPQEQVTVKTFLQVFKLLVKNGLIWDLGSFLYWLQLVSDSQSAGSAIKQPHEAERAKSSVG